MILCLDVGNSQIYGGVMNGKEILLRFRYETKIGITSDQFGVFFKAVLRENGINCQEVKDIAFCSVVPSLDYSLRSACVKYFNIEPFVLNASVQTGLQMMRCNPREVGADLIAGAIGAVDQFPNKNIVIIDFGTATTLMGISSKQEFLGGIILAGIRLSMNALSTQASKLFPVEILKPDHVVGRSTIESIQAGLYYGTLGAVRELLAGTIAESFQGQKPIVIGTGGFSHLFEHENLYTILLPDLLLNGLRIALEKNRQS